MISVTEDVNPARLGIQTSICKCGKVHMWRPPQQSPYNCMGGCGETMPDITKMILKSEWRIAYHLGGRAAVNCGVSL